ncbi:MAG TPA: transglycosylase SLT domain-containing protein [Ignavibacteria bacterium]|nr:transglycosylase SLT domain-containing protein [Ignavibacteria bacterium]
MQNKLIINTVKRLFSFGIVLIIAIYALTFNGCGGSEDEELVTQRNVDSLEIYSKLQKGFAEYKSALSYNEKSDDINANREFEASLKSLNEINPELLSKGEYYFWKKDFDELSKSIVEDYFSTQTEIPENSLVFNFAKRVFVEYERVEEVSADREPLPDGSDVPLIRNSVVDGYIEFFSNTERGRSFIDKSLYRSGKYFPLMRKILKYNNAPEELIYLSVQESGLNPTIVSKAGAVGLWQFMPATGVSYGLGSDGYRDDRRDFEKATDAAAHLLKDLYKTYDDWYLAFSAYNAGPGRVNKAIRNSGSRDFWSLRGFLPGETKNYTPSILALSFVLRNPEEYGFKEIEYGTQLTFDRVEVQAQLTMQQVAEMCDTDVETIRDLNTELTSDIIPDYNEPYLLRIPHNSFDKFLANYNKSNEIDKSSGFAPAFAGNESGDFGSEVTGSYYKVKNYTPLDLRLIGSTSGLKKVDHSYNKNEPLPVVAAFYDVRATDLRIWNNLNYGSMPGKNSKLSVYISEEKYKLMYGLKNGTEIPVENKNDQNEITSSFNKTGSKENESVKTDIASNSTTDERSKDQTEFVKIPNNNAGVTTQVFHQNTDQNSVEESKAEEISDPDPTQTSFDNETVIETAESETQENQAVEETVEETAEEDTEETGSEYEDTITNAVTDENSTVKNSINKSNYSKIYTVTEGDNLSKIAAEYGLTVSELKEINGLKEDVIYSGEKLKVSESKSPPKNSGKTTTVKKTYKVKKGDTLASISSKNKVSIKDLKAWNGLKGDKVMYGQVLKLYK